MLDDRCTEPSRLVITAAICAHNDAAVLRDAVASVMKQTLPGSNYEVLVVGTLSPGPMLDAWEQRSIGPQPVIAPWSPRGMPAVGRVTQVARRSSPVVDR